MDNKIRREKYERDRIERHLQELDELEYLAMKHLQGADRQALDTILAECDAIRQRLVRIMDTI